MAAHPFIDLLREGPIARLWSGLALSAVGAQLATISLIWLAVGTLGGDAALLLTASNATLLIVSLLSGAFIDRFPARLTLIASELGSAVFVLLPVAMAFFMPLGLPVLLIAAIGIGGCSALIQPALLSTVPILAGDRIQALNGLLDATSRLSRLGGPFLAGLLSVVLSTLQLMAVAALGFLISAAAIASLGRRIDHPQTAEPPADQKTSAVHRLLSGWHAARADRDVRRVLIANTLILFAWGPAVTLGLPLLVAETGGTLGTVALLVGAYGAGDFVSNVLVSAHKPRRPGPFMFTGYVILGTALIAVPLAGLALPDPLRLPAMMAACFVSAAGGPMFFLPMMTIVQTRIAQPRIASVLRLRLALVAGSIMTGSALSPLLFGSLGAGLTIVACGAFIGLVGAAGTALCADLEPLR